MLACYTKLKLAAPSRRNFSARRLIVRYLLYFVFNMNISLTSIITRYKSSNTLKIILYPLKLFAKVNIFEISIKLHCWNDSLSILYKAWRY